jgi:hypothetical protein
MAAVSTKKGYWHSLLVHLGLRDCCDKPNVVVRRLGTLYYEEKCLHCHYARPSTRRRWW